MKSFAELKQNYQLLTDEEFLTLTHQQFSPDMDIKEFKKVVGYQEPATLKTIPKAFAREVFEGIREIPMGFVNKLINTLTEDVKPPTPSREKKIQDYEKVKEWARNWKNPFETSEKEKQDFVLGQIPSALGSAVRFMGYAVAFKGARLAPMYFSSYGRSYMDIEKEKPEWSEKKKDEYATYQGVAETASELIGTDFLLQPFKGMSTTTLRKAWKNTALYKNTLNALGKGFITEGTQEGSQTMISNAIDKLYKIDKGLFDDVVNSIILGGIVGSSMGGIASVGTNININNVHKKIEAYGFTEQESNEIYNSVNELLDKEIQNDPESIQEMLKLLVDTTETLNRVNEAETKLTEKLESKGMPADEVKDTLSRLDDTAKIDLAERVEAKETEETLQAFDMQKQTMKEQVVQAGYESDKLGKTKIDLAKAIPIKIERADVAGKGELMQDPLVSEALKYDSAEEFVNSYGLYHGTPAEIEGGSLKFGAGGQLKKGGYMGGHFLSDTESIADVFSFGGKVYRASSEIKNKTLDVNKNKKLFKNMIGKEYESDGEMIEFTQQGYDAMFPNGKADWSTIDLDLVQQVAKKENKVGIAIPEYAGGKEGMTYQLFEDEIPIYTRQQLTDIYNEAHSLKQEGDKVSKLSRRGADGLETAYGITIDDADLVKYHSLINQEQIDRAMVEYEKDPMRALNIALGNEKSNDGILETAYLVVAEIMTRKTKDMEAYQMLATQSSLAKEASMMGQFIQMLSNIDKDSPMRAVQEVAKTRVEAYNKVGKVKADVVISKESKKLKETVDKSFDSLDKEIDNFIKELEC